jgi:predicted enzyme related to lactoylglutathione lyase
LFDWKIDKAPGIDYFRIQTDSEKGNGIAGGLLNRPIQGPRSWVHYVLVDSIDQTIERIQALGGKLLRPKTAVPKTAWYAVVEDPEGNIFAVYQHDALAMPMPVPED